VSEESAADLSYDGLVIRIDDRLSNPSAPFSHGFLGERTEVSVTVSGAAWVAQAGEGRAILARSVSVLYGRAAPGDPAVVERVCLSGLVSDPAPERLVSWDGDAEFVVTEEDILDERFPRWLAAVVRRYRPL